MSMHGQAGVPWWAAEVGYLLMLYSDLSKLLHSPVHKLGYLCLSYLSKRTRLQLLLTLRHLLHGASSVFTSNGTFPAAHSKQMWIHSWRRMHKYKYKSRPDTEIRFFSSMNSSCHWCVGAVRLLNYTPYIQVHVCC